MEKTRGIISANIEKHGHFEEYFKIIDIIQANEFKNPDICIESCKALIEGISKTIIVNLDNTRTAENIDDDNLPKLFKESMNLLSDNCEDIEGDFVVRFSAIIQVLGEIRNKRGDISHGRMAPKAIYSSYKLATTVKNMTESMLEYVLEHYFSIDFSNGKLVYDELEEYNNWLDENTDFPIKKAKYSQLLYENDLDEYENRYNNDFLKTDEEEIPIREVEKVENETKVKEEPLQKVVETAQPEKEVEELVGTFDEDIFWQNPRNTQLEVFSEKEDLKINELRSIINGYLFTDKKPLRDEVSNAMISKPPLKERGKIIDSLTDRIIEFAEKIK